jgi:hypothetical protein
MKNKTTTLSTAIKTQKDRHIRPENKDNLDSIKNEEQDIKVDDITHNRKEYKNKRPFRIKSIDNH